MVVRSDNASGLLFQALSKEKLSVLMFSQHRVAVVYSRRILVNI